MHAHPGSRRSLRVLVVEDNPGDAKLVAALLAASDRLECMIETRGTVAGALAYLADVDAEAEPDVILLDLSLPDATGVEGVAKLAKSGTTLPIVVLTGLEDDETAQQAVAQGAQEYLLKSDMRSIDLSHAIEHSITRKQLAARGRELEKREALGRLAAGMAHELNNLFTVMLASTYDLKDRLREEENLTDIASIERAVRQGANIVKHVLAIGRRDRLSVRVVDLVAAVRAFEGPLRSRVPEDVEIIFPPAGEPVPGLLDAASLDQIFSILLDNAVRSGAREVRVVVDRVARESDEPGGGSTTFTRLAVADNGHGMTAAVVARVFDPFYSTRAPGEGTGLGLPAVRGMVEQQDGRVEIDSIPGEGTTISVLFATAPEGAAVWEAPKTVPIQMTDPKVLVVDDLVGVRAVVSRALRRVGYSVVEAEDGLAGLEAVRAEAGAVDLIVSDVVMPRLSGVEMYSAIRDEFGPIPILFISGYPASDFAQESQLEPEWRLLKKPFEIADLLDSIGALTAGTPPDEGPASP